MKAQVLDGRTTASAIKAELRERVAVLHASGQPKTGCGHRADALMRRHFVRQYRLSEDGDSGKARLGELATRFGLAITGSSDYHGDGKPNRLGENTTEPEVLEQIIAAGTGAAPSAG